MAIKTIRLDDATLLKYQEMHPQNPTLAIENQLERYKNCSYKERILIFDAETRKELEKLYGKPIEDAPDMLRWVKNCLVFKAGDVEIPLTEGQRKRLQGEALHMGANLNDYLKKRIENAIFNAIGA